MKIVVMANKKGGVGKTTTTQNLGAGLARLGYRILAIDCDNQANLTTGWGVPIDSSPSLIDILRGLATWQEAAITVETFGNVGDGGGCVLIPATRQLAAIPMLFAEEVGKEMILKEKLETLPKGYDVVLLDSSPNLDLMALNAYVAATDVLVPVQCEAYALQGLGLLMDDIRNATKRLNPQLRITGVLPTMYDGRKRLGQDVLDSLREGFPNEVCQTVIRDAVTLAEAPSHGQSIMVYDPKGYGSADYMALASEMAERLGLRKE